MKKLINNPDDVVRESLEGMAAAHSDLIKVNFDPHFIYRADAPVQGKVASSPVAVADTNPCTAALSVSEC